MPTTNSRKLNVQCAREEKRMLAFNWPPLPGDGSSSESFADTSTRSLSLPPVCTLRSLLFLHIYRLLAGFILFLPCTPLSASHHGGFVSGPCLTHACIHMYALSTCAYVCVCVFAHKVLLHLYVLTL